MISKQPEEVSFPRGSADVVKADPVDDKNDKQGKVLGKKRKAEKDLFSNKSGIGSKEKKAKKKEKDKNKVKKSALDITNVSGLSYSQLAEGQVLLGIVSQVVHPVKHPEIYKFIKLLKLPSGAGVRGEGLPPWPPSRQFAHHKHFACSHCQDQDCY